MPRIFPNRPGSNVWRANRIEKGQIDPSYVVSHRISLDEAPHMYEVWRDKQEQVAKIVIDDPWMEKAA